MSWWKRHVGEWISVRAHAERKPPRLTLTIALGELPEGWARPRPHARAWVALLGLFCIAPFIALLIATLLRALGFGSPYEWLAGSSIAILSATISLFIGIPIAITINLWRIARLGLHRSTGAIEGLIALEFAPLHLLVVLMAVLIGGLFVGHLAADSYACVKGVRSAC